MKITPNASARGRLWSITADSEQFRVVINVHPYTWSKRHTKVYVGLASGEARTPNDRRQTLALNKKRRAIIEQANALLENTELEGLLESKTRFVRDRWSDADDHFSLDDVFMIRNRWTDIVPTYVIETISVVEKRA